MTHDIWVEVDLAALRHNLGQVRHTVGDGVKIMAVVKSNGFGHGYVEPARAFVEAGADALAVTRLDEAITLREAGIEAPILLFAPIQPENAEAAIAANLEMTVSGIELARNISEAAQRLGKTARIHVKIDTGMGRLGVPVWEALNLFDLLNKLPNVTIAGTYTHFSTAAEREFSRSRVQLTGFSLFLDCLQVSRTDYGLAHCANSAAMLRMPESHLDMVRPGTLLYGQYPSSYVPRKLDLRPTWKLKARVCEVKEIASGRPIGYGSESTTKRPTKTAVIPVGWSDGFTLAPEGPIYRQSLLKFAARKIRRQLAVEIRGLKAPVLGRVAMQMIVVDVTDVPGVQVGDEVIVPAMRIPTSALIPRSYIG